eukprot:UN01409
MAQPLEQLQWKGDLKAHKGAITAIATHPAVPDYIITASRDKSIIVWRAERDQTTETYGVPMKRFVGHNHFVSDLALTTDAQKNLFILSGSWDKSLRLWDFNKGKSTLRFVNHTKDVLSVAFSADNRQIVSGSRDRTIKVWNTLGQCKMTFQQRDNGHKDWVSAVRFSPSVEAPLLVSAGWDKLIKVWDMKALAHKNTLAGHTGYINTVTVSPDGTLVASGGRDGLAKLWDLSEGKELYSLDTGDVINALAFSPVRYWLVAATQSSIVVWDLETKVQLECIKFNGQPEVDAEEEGIVADKKKQAAPLAVTSLAWSPDGSVLYAGYSNNVVRAYVVVQAQDQ